MSVDLVAQFLVERVRERAGRHFPQGRRQPPFVTRSMSPSLRRIAEYRMRGVSQTAARALVAWSNGEYRAELLHRVPSALEVLEWSAAGKRCVSLLDRPDALEFLLHDLEHLEKFFDARHHAEQVGFFRALAAAFADSRFAALEADLDGDWAHERDRVLADMNGSSLFLYCALKSRLRHACSRAGVDFHARCNLLHSLMRLPLEISQAATSFLSRDSPVAAGEMLVAYFRAVARWGPRPSAEEFGHAALRD